MARYTLTKNYSEIAESCGLFQNSSGNAEIEITNDVAEAGIILRPFQYENLFLHNKHHAPPLSVQETPNHYDKKGK